MTAKRADTPRPSREKCERSICSPRALVTSARQCQVSTSAAAVRELLSLWCTMEFPSLCFPFLICVIYTPIHIFGPRVILYVLLFKRDALLLFFEWLMDGSVFYVCISNFGTWLTTGWNIRRELGVFMNFYLYEEIEVYWTFVYGLYSFKSRRPIFHSHNIIINVDNILAARDCHMIKYSI